MPRAEYGQADDFEIVGKKARHYLTEGENAGPFLEVLRDGIDQERSS